MAKQYLPSPSPSERLLPEEMEMTSSAVAILSAKGGEGGRPMAFARADWLGFMLLMFWSFKKKK